MANLSAEDVVVPRPRLDRPLSPCSVQRASAGARRKARLTKPVTTHTMRHYGSTTFDTQEYVLGYAYDRNGRRRILEHPSNVAPTVGGREQAEERQRHDYDLFQSPP